MIFVSNIYQRFTSFIRLSFEDSSGRPSSMKSSENKERLFSNVFFNDFFGVTISVSPILLMYSSSFISYLNSLGIRIA